MHIHCYEVTVVKVEIKIFGVTPEIFVSAASHICNAILTVSGKSSDLTVPGMWPLCYSWIGYLQANGSAVSPALCIRGSLMCHIGMSQMTRTLQ